MEFYSHAKKSEAGKNEGTKLLTTHLQQVKNNCLGILFSKLRFSIVDELTINQFVTDVALLHDLGKYTTYFQNYLLNNETQNSQYKTHARLGAFLFYNLWKEKNPLLAFFGYYIIKNHHLDLKNLNDDMIFHKTEQIVVDDIFKKQIVTIQTYLQQIEKETGIAQLNEKLILPKYSELKNIFYELEDTPSIENYFFINYTFSLLTEADKIDASGAEVYKTQQNEAKLIDNLWGVPQKILKESFVGLPQNDLRNHVRAMVIENLLEKDFFNHNLYTLTAPTGIGKTLTALDFALKMRGYISENQNYNARIICALPFINIIEQTLSVYEKVIGNKLKVLAHYQFADVFGDEKEYSEDKDYNRKKMELDTWQADVIITSFVQFLETLIGNRNKLLKKFNRFAGSIIILDEVQTIQLGILPLVGSALFYLAKYLNCKILLMTATKPKIYELANREILCKENEQAIAVELLKDFKPIFETFNRTKIVALIEKPFNETKDFLNLFNEKWTTEKSCLIVCNKVNRSIELFNLIKDFLNEIDASNPIFYLSTNITPHQRSEVIKKIRKEMSKRKPIFYFSKNITSHQRNEVIRKEMSKRKPVLIATQVVEAGVDLDFDMGFRDVGPIDSMVQVAGRINRNCKKKDTAPLYIVDFKDCEKIYDIITYNTAIKTLKNIEGEIPESRYLELVEFYFDKSADAKSWLKSRNIFHALKNLLYSENNDNALADFHLINEAASTKSIFVETDLEAIEAKNAYFQYLNQEISVEVFQKNFKRIFHQRIINVPEYFTQNLILEGKRAKLFDELFIIRKDFLNEFYDNDTGFIRKNLSDEGYCL